MKYFLVKQLGSAQGVQVIGWGVDEEILEHTRKAMVDASDFRVISENDLYKIVTEFV
jgi:hypothetical protein